MEDQRDLISNHEQLPMLSQRPGAQESKCSRGALYTSFSVLVALLLAGQATMAYFLYHQQGQLDKLTVTSQNLQLENLRMKLPKCKHPIPFCPDAPTPPYPHSPIWVHCPLPLLCNAAPPQAWDLSTLSWPRPTLMLYPSPTAAKPVGKMRMATPMLMRALPMEGLLQGPMQNATKYGNTTQDHVMHMLLKSDPLKVYPQLKGNFPENLKHLKNTMEGLDWKVFESWMQQWLLFEMSKNSLEETPTEAPVRALTKCQEEVSHIPAVHPGMFRPQCDENGNYMPLQCYGSIGYCWCVFPNGTEVPHTRSRGRHNCSGKQWCGAGSEEQAGSGTRGPLH
ncbi:HLA class II histocompatibility antigen gamma chain, partial [Galemys pyrenaicus]